MDLPSGSNPVRFVVLVSSVPARILYVSKKVSKLFRNDFRYFTIRGKTRSPYVSIVSAQVTSDEDPYEWT